jgi:hypothetical protein
MCSADRLSKSRRPCPGRTGTTCSSSSSSCPARSSACAALAPCTITSPSPAAARACDAHSWSSGTSWVSTKIGTPTWWSPCQRPAPVVVIPGPAARELESTPAGDHRSRGHQLVEQRFQAVAGDDDVDHAGFVFEVHRPLPKRSAGLLSRQSARDASSRDQVMVDRVRLTPPSLACAAARLSKVRCRAGSAGGVGPVVGPNGVK